MAMAMAITAALDSIETITDFHSLLVGYNFEPSDQNLLEDYLFNKINGYKYFQGPVLDCDLYGHSEPWEIWESFGGIDGQDLYFFTKLKRSTNNSGQLSAHITRKIGLAGGTWSGENSPDSIFSTKYQRDFGYCKRFRYENVQLPDHHAEWIMHEYSLHEDCILEGADPNYVLCRIRKKERLNKKGRKRCHSETLQPVEQTVMGPEMINKLPCKRKITTNPNIGNVPWIPKITTNQDISNVLWEPEIATYEDMNDVFDLPTISIAQDTSDVPYMSTRTTNKVTSSMPCFPEMTTNKDNGDVFYLFEMTTNEGSSDVFYVSNTTTNEGANNMAEMIADKEETAFDKWKAFLNCKSLDDLVDF